MTRKPTPNTILDDVLTTDASRNTQLYAGNIKRDGGTQMRADLDPATVKEYADAMAEAGGWHNFPPVITYHDGTDNWLADGFHRLAAYLSRFSASGLIPADVRSGTRRDAILHAAGANASHGLRRTNADKRRAVETLLRDEEWAVWSDHEIARRCAVSQPFVSDVRKKLTDNGYQSPAVRKGADGRSINTANIGAKPGPVPAPIPQPTPREYSAAVQDRSPISNPAPVTVDVLPPSDAPLPDWAQEPTSISKPGQSVADYLAYKEQANAIGGAYLNIREWRQWLDNGAPVIHTDADIAPPAHRIVGYSVLDDIALRAAADLADGIDAIDAYESFSVSDGRIPAAQRLIALYRETIATESQYGALTGHFSDWLAPKRELEAMIAQLEHLISVIQHPEEVTPDN